MIKRSLRPCRRSLHIRATTRRIRQALADAPISSAYHVAMYETSCGEIVEFGKLRHRTVQPLPVSYIRQLRSDCTF